MLKVFLLWIFFLGFTFFAFLSGGELKYANIGDLPLQNGDTLYHCSIGYHTAGKLNSDSSNIIVYLTWFGGNSGNLYSLLGPQKLLDTAQYYVIMIDALGNGVSSSPSNYFKNEKRPFPEIMIQDMVQSQYILLRKTLGYKSIQTFIGGSMGSMQVLHWLAVYPEFARKFIAYVPTPQSSVYDLLYWTIQEHAITSGMANNIPPAEYMKGVNLLTQMKARTPDYLVNNVSHSRLDTIIMNAYRNPDTVFTPANFLAQIGAMKKHDIYKYADAGKIYKHAKEKLFLIVSRYDHILHPEPAMKLGRESGCRVKVFESDCGHLVIGCQMEESRNLIAEFLKE